MATQPSSRVAAMQLRMHMPCLSRAEIADVSSARALPRRAAPPRRARCCARRAIVLRTPRLLRPRFRGLRATRSHPRLTPLRQITLPCRQAMSMAPNGRVLGRVRGRGLYIELVDIATLGRFRKQDLPPPTATH